MKFFKDLLGARHGDIRVIARVILKGADKANGDDIKQLKKIAGE